MTGVIADAEATPTAAIGWGHEEAPAQCYLPGAVTGSRLEATDEHQG